jgi:hypothetical protein
MAKWTVKKLLQLLAKKWIGQLLFTHPRIKVNAENFLSEFFHH